jgi:hypothetical protein
MPVLTGSTVQLPQVHANPQLLWAEPAQRTMPAHSPLLVVTPEPPMPENASLSSRLPSDPTVSHPTNVSLDPTAMPRELPRNSPPEFAPPTMLTTSHAITTRIVSRTVSVASASPPVPRFALPIVKVDLAVLKLTTLSLACPNTAAKEPVTTAVDIRTVAIS